MVSVLLIDDDDDFREEIRIGLERAGFRVTAVESGDDGVEIFKQDPHDVVITDVVMDRGEGIGTMNRLHNLAPGLPVIAVSGHEDYLKTMKKLGATHSLFKPFKLASLIDALEEVA